MTRELINSTQTIFEKIKKIDENGNEFWGARQFAKALDYTDFRNFLVVVNKAKEACKKSGQTISLTSTRWYPWGPGLVEKWKA